MTGNEHYEKRGATGNGGWIVNYDPDRALANYRFLCRLGLEPRVFVSRDCAAIVLSASGLDQVRDPHVRAWRESFFELQPEEFVRRVQECLRGMRNYLGETEAMQSG